MKKNIIKYISVFITILLFIFLIKTTYFDSNNNIKNNKNEHIVNNNKIIKEDKIKLQKKEELIKQFNKKQEIGDKYREFKKYAPEYLAKFYELNKDKGVIDDIDILNMKETYNLGEKSNILVGYIYLSNVVGNLFDFDSIIVNSDEKEYDIYEFMKNNKELNFKITKENSNIKERTLVYKIILVSKNKDLLNKLKIDLKKTNKISLISLNVIGKKQKINLYKKEK